MEFINDSSALRFSVAGESFYCESYYPDSGANLKEYGVLFMLSPYYTAELDYKEVFVSGNKSTVGWIMPLSLLEEKDASVIKDSPKFLRRFADIAIKKLISWYIKNHGMSDVKTDECVLSAMYNSGLSIFIYRLSMLPLSEISAYYPALYDNGYYYVDNPISTVDDWYVSDHMNRVADEKRKDGIHMVTLRRIKYLNYGMDYIHVLYKSILPSSHDIFQRFIVLYQVMEILMVEEFECDVFKINVDYAKGAITKNDLRKCLQESTAEDSKINRALDGVSEDELMKEFKDDVVNLFGQIGRDYNKCHTYADFVYQMRNTIVHNLRELVSYENVVRDIVELYEKNVFHILCNHTIKEDVRNMLFYADMTISKKANVRRFRSFLSEKSIR